MRIPGSQTFTPFVKCAFVVAFAAMTISYLYGKIDYRDPSYATWELHDYREMAEAFPHLSDNVKQPFAFRVLGPYIAGMLPWATDTSFAVVSTLAGVALALLLYAFLSRTIVTPAVAALTTILFLLNKYQFGFPTWNYFQLTDILVDISIALLFWTLSLQRWLLFGVALAVGVLTKEPALLLVPVAIAYVLEKRLPPRTWLVLTVACLPAIACWLVLRLTLQGVDGRSLAEAFSQYADKGIRPETWFRLLVNGFIPLSLLPFVFFDTTRRYFRDRKYALLYFLLVLVSTLFGLNNERLMGPAFIVYYSLIAMMLQEYGTPSRGFMITLLMCAGVASLHHTYARFPIPRDWSVAISATALLVATAAAFFAKRRIQRHGRLNLRPSGLQT